MTKTEKLIKMYEESALRLLSLLPELEGRRAKQTEMLIQQIYLIINRLVEESGQLAADILSESYQNGMTEAMKVIAAHSEGATTAGAAANATQNTMAVVIQPIVHTAAVQQIVDEVFYCILEASDHMSQDAKSRIMNAVQIANQRSLIEGVSRRQATKDAVAELAQQQITGMVAKNGARIPADKYMAGVIQYHQRKAHVEGVLNTCTESGWDLVYVNFVGVTCEVCAQYQGRVYSLSGRDKRFPKLEHKPPYHSHCVHNATPWIERLKTDAEVQEMIKLSNRPFNDNRTAAQIKAYNDIQRSNSRRNETRKQWMRYKARIPDTPDLRTFASQKVRNTSTYTELQQLYREVGTEIKKRGGTL